MSNLMPQGDRRIHVHGPPRGNLAGEQRDQDQDHWRARHGKRIIRRHADQLRLQNAIHREGCRQAGDHTGGHGEHAIAQDHPADVLGSRADRHANSNFLSTLAYRMRDHGVEPDGCQQHGNQGEDGRHRGVLAQLRMLQIHAVRDETRSSPSAW